MYSKINFKPVDKTPINLFANKGEAIVFWLSLAGLLFLGIISLFRYLNADLIRENYREKEIAVEQFQTEIESLKTQQQKYQNQVRSLQERLTQSRNQIQELNKAIQQSKAGIISPGKDDRILKPKKDERSKKVLEEFQIKRPDQ